MLARIKKIKQNIINKSINEKWNNENKTQYLKKISCRINTYQALIDQRDDYEDILYIYLERKINELKIIHDFLEKKWKK